jgi:hypothetical protein
MMVMSILTRRLRDGKTYEDFRKVWYHTVGFGGLAKLYSAINAFDQREIIVVGLVQIEQEQDPLRILQIDVEERLSHPLEEIIEPEIGRRYGIVVSEDDFSPAGELNFKPASVGGRVTDFNEVTRGLALAQELFSQAASEREKGKKTKN